MTSLKERFEEKFTDSRGMYVDLSPMQQPAPQRLTKRAYADVLAFIEKEIERAREEEYDLAQQFMYSEDELIVAERKAHEAGHAAATAEVKTVIVELFKTIKRTEAGAAQYSILSLLVTKLTDTNNDTK